MLATTLIVLVLHELDHASGLLEFEHGVGFLSSVYTVATLAPTLAVTIRRLHDSGSTWWWLFVPLVPLVGLILFLYMLVRPGTHGDNRYGPDPKIT